MSIWKAFKAATPKALHSFGRGNRIHVCALCGKPRSTRYRTSHPSTPGQIPKPGICSRPTCLSFQKRESEGDESPPKIYFEVHHYYHNYKARINPIDAAEMSGQSSSTGRAEMIGDLQYGLISQKNVPGSLFLIRDEPPPPVNTLTKPIVRC
jgi:hypothetical protein